MGDVLRAFPSERAKTPISLKRNPTQLENLAPPLAVQAALEGPFIFEAGGAQRVPGLRAVPRAGRAEMHWARWKIFPQQLKALGPTVAWGSSEIGVP